MYSVKLGGFHCTSITHLFGRQLLRDELQLLDDVGGLVEPRLVGEDGGEGRVLASQELVEVAHQAQRLVVAGAGSVHGLEL